MLLYCVSFLSVCDIFGHPFEEVLNLSTVVLLTSQQEMLPVENKQMLWPNLPPAHWVPGPVPGRLVQ